MVWQEERERERERQKESQAGHSQLNDGKREEKRIRKQKDKRRRRWKERWIEFEMKEREGKGQNLPNVLYKLLVEETRLKESWWEWPKESASDFNTRREEKMQRFSLSNYYKYLPITVACSSSRFIHSLEETHLKKHNDQGDTGSFCRSFLLRIKTEIEFFWAEQEVTKQ